MSEGDTSRIAVVRDTLLDGLKAVERLRKLPKKQRVFTFWLEGDELCLSNGVINIRIAATGHWPDTAVLPPQALEVLRSLVESADPARPILLEAASGCVMIGSARIPCTYRPQTETAEIAMEAEKLRQRAIDPVPLAETGPRRPGNRRDGVLAQIRDLRPDFEIIPPYEQRVAAFRDVPRLIVRVTSLWLEFHFLDDPGQDKSAWLQHSTLWKKVDFQSMSALGLKEVLDYAVHAAGMASAKP